MLIVLQGGGIQDVKFIPGNNESAAIATAVHLGQVWIIYPFRIDANGNQGVATLLYDLGEKARDTIAIYSDITRDGKFAYCKCSPLPVPRAASTDSPLTSIPSSHADNRRPHRGP